MVSGQFHVTGVYPRGNSTSEPTGYQTDPDTQDGKQSSAPSRIQLRITERSAPTTRLYGLGKKKFNLYQGSLAGIKRLRRECSNSYLTPRLGMSRSIPQLLLYAFMTRPLFSLDIGVIFGECKVGAPPPPRHPIFFPT